DELPGRSLEDADNLAAGPEACLAGEADVNDVPGDGVERLLLRNVDLARLRLCADGTDEAMPGLGFAKGAGECVLGVRNRADRMALGQLELSLAEQLAHGRLEVVVIRPWHGEFAKEGLGLERLIAGTREKGEDLLLQWVHVLHSRAKSQVVRGTGSAIREE